MAGRIPLAATTAALALAASAAGCCGLTRSAGLRGLDRDTPERAFEFVRAAFAEDATADQYDSFHPDFRDARGLSRARYLLGRNLEPGLFERAASLLAEAEIVPPVERGVLERADGRGRRAVARITLRTPRGSGVFILVDEPAFRLCTSDPDLGRMPPLAVDPAALEGAVRVGPDGRSVVVRFEAPLGAAALDPAAEVHRFELHHDWLLLDIERLEGFEEFLGEVRDAADRSGGDAPPPKEDGK
jgi:hypothetical protein